MKAQKVNKTVYLPYSGGSIWGKGVIKEKDDADLNKSKYVFENEKGKIYFNSLSDRQIKNVEFIFTIEQFTEVLSNFYVFANEGEVKHEVINEFLL